MRIAAAVVLLDIAACSEPEPDPAGDEGRLGFELQADYGSGALVRGTPIAAGDEVVIVTSPLGEDNTRSFQSSDPDVIDVAGVESVTVCDTFTLIGSCDRVPTGEREVTIRAGRAGVATLEALRDDGTVLDRIDVEVAEVVGFRALEDAPWRYEGEVTRGVEPVDADGRAVWLGRAARWEVTPLHRLQITSEHRHDLAHEVRAIAFEPGEGVLTVTGPGGASGDFEIVVE